MEYKNEKMSRLEMIIAERKNQGADLKEIVAKITEWISHEIVDTGKIFKLDLYELTENGLFNFIDMGVLESHLVSLLALNNRLVFKKDSAYVYSFECKKKIVKLMNLSKLQKLIYDLYDSNRPLALTALNKMSNNDRQEMETILTFER
ncbi:hypothetical protein [Bacillus velezensis]|uniref:hypothetical protein n=1 Tax=Bacillus velezensis TaxID=492670 RepID=UPI001A932019|nr:hypothetical protein [Bacillus velezensis]BCT30330.1 hypothetical protein BVAD3_40040 [Bacillus velezensis]